jgi:hypothetical protein
VPSDNPGAKHYSLPAGGEVRAMQPANGDEDASARRLLEAFVDECLSLDALIAWAEKEESTARAGAWRRRAASALANPLMCREEALARVYQLLREAG